MSEARIGISTNTKSAEQGVTTVKGLFASLQADAKRSILTGVGLGAGVSAFNALAGAAKSVIGYLSDAVGAASDLAETQSKVKVVFGDSAKTMFAWGATAASALGLSTQKALEAAGTFGNLFTAMKISVPAAADMSKGIIQLAADLASFNNQNPEDVLIALRAGLVGETEPLRKFGINLNAAAIATEAVRLGLAKTTSEVSTAAKAQAAYSLIMAQSTTAQGDFARTTDGLANTQRTLDAQFQDISAELGRALLPAMAQLANIAKKDLLPALKAAIPVLVSVSGAVLELARLAIPLLTVALGVKLVAAFKAAQVTGVTSATAVKLAWGAALLGIPFLLEHLREQSQDALTKHPPLPWDWLIGSPFAAAKAGEESGEALKGGLFQGWGQRGPISDALKAEMADLIAKANGTFVKPIILAMSEARRKAIEIARAIPGDIAKALIGARNDIESGLTSLKELMKDSLSDAAKIARDKGILSSKALAAGLRDERADVRAAAMQLRDDTLAELELLESGAADIAVDTGATLAASLQAVRGPVAEAALAVARGVQNALKIESGPGGWNVGATWADQLIAALKDREAAFRIVVGRYAGKLIGFSPPKEGPLKDIDKGGFNVGKAWAQGMTKGIGSFKLPNLGAGGLSGGGLTPVFAGAGGGSPVVIQLQVDGRTLAEIVDRNLYYQSSGASRLPRG